MDNPTFPALLLARHPEEDGDVSMLVGVKVIIATDREGNRRPALHVSSADGELTLALMDGTVAIGHELVGAHAECTGEDDANS